MADISAFPSIKDVLYAGDNLQDFTATTAVKGGQVVKFSATGVAMAVDMAVAESGEHPIGVALYDAAAGSKVAVAMNGCIVYVANADDTTAFDAGDGAETNDNAVGGTVSPVAIAATGGATVTVHPYTVGIMLDKTAGGGTGRMLIAIAPQAVQANSS